MMEIMTDALMVAFKLMAPPLLISLVVGLVIAILQAATQIHEQTLTFVPKLVAIGIALIVLGPWMIDTMNDFTFRLFDFIATYA